MDNIYPLKLMNNSHISSKQVLCNFRRMLLLAMIKNVHGIMKFDRRISIYVN
ncbi:hypothetical protein [Pantoea sp. Aalb]|uniref:hypothetical protein n=1 Tax=Pantoea sp. Aalb TaxID=2576762 RepID=UPI001F17B6C5|nr:hypothetical protein [Pantoea sp. Aalb]